MIGIKFFRYTAFTMVAALLGVILPIAVQSQDILLDTVVEEMTLIEKIDRTVSFYGSLRFATGVTFAGQFGMNDNSSRIGLRGRIPITENMAAIAQLELGVGLIGDNRTIVWSGDPGGGAGEINNVFRSRLGWVGIDTKVGSFTWGKQWSPYSSVSGFTNMFPFFGADASGTFAANTDGSQSGTGRAANAFQYNLDLKIVEFGVQVQSRNITDSNRNFADTYAGSVIFNFAKYFHAGIAYNQVLDGVKNPGIGESKYGDKAGIVGLMYQDKRWYQAAIVCRFANHEIDDLGNFFDGTGVEYYGRYNFAEKWAVFWGFNYQIPDKDSDAGQFKISYLDTGASYTIGKISQAFVELKLDNGRNHDGQLTKQSVIGFGMYFNFAY